MKKSQTLLIYPLILIGISLVFGNSCSKDNIYAVLTTTEVTEITQTSATTGGDITNDGGLSVTARGVSLFKENQTTELSRTEDGTGSGSFVSRISGLEPNTVYHVKAYATNSEGTFYGLGKSFATRFGGFGSTLTDQRDGNIYQTVTIGNQVWMAENLKYLPSVYPGTSSETNQYYYVNGYNGTNVAEAKSTINYNTYGVLYNWPAAMEGSLSSTANPSGVKGVCPIGWHLPSDAEWTELTLYVGGEIGTADKLKERGEAHWGPIWSLSATNETGFTAIPGGFCNGSFFLEPYYSGIWWSATLDTNSYSRSMSLYYANNNIARNHSWKQLGLSIRCVKD
jgi:uncharacterized protein (TIGR02145 family)